MKINEIYAPLTVVLVVLLLMLGGNTKVEAVCSVGQYVSVVGEFDKDNNFAIEQQCKEITEASEMNNSELEKNGADTWYLSYKSYLLDLAKMVALIVKSGALISLIYSGMMYMRIVSDVKAVIGIKANIISAFTALFLASFGGVIIDIFLRVVA